MSDATEPWGLDGLLDLWALTLGDSAVTIAVLDGPCDLSHPCLKGALIDQLSLGGHQSAAGPAGDHGTHTTSIIFGQHDSPVCGIAPKCHGLLVPIFGNDRYGEISPCPQPELARAIRLAAREGADVINISGGQFSPGGIAHPLLAEAVRKCGEEGRLIVAAAGNNGCPCLHVPGALPAVLAVGAMDADGGPMEFSNWGESYLTNGVLAPGVNVLGAVPGGGTAFRTGTSYATPIVAGLAGLLLSLQRMRGERTDSQSVRAAILDSALGCAHQEVPDCRRLLAGRVNVSGAVSRVLGGSEAMSNHPVQPAVSDAADSNTKGNQPAPVGVLAALAEETVGAAAAEERPVHAAAHSGPKAHMAAVSPSDCACKNRGQLVYAIGDLDIDFGTLARQDSLQQSAEGFLRGGRLDLRINGHLLRHFLGWRDITGLPAAAAGAEESKREPRGQRQAPERSGPREKIVYHKPHLYDAQAVIWVLRQDESPVYAVRPAGPYAADGYLELIRFLMEQEGYSDSTAVDEAEGKPPVTYYPSLDTRDGAEPNRSTDSRGRPVRLVERVAIPGTLDGTVKLYNGAVVPVICPDMRGTLAWRMDRLLKMHQSQAAGGEEQQREMRNLERVAQRFFEEARNTGLSPEERALNFAATRTFRSVPDLRVKFGADIEWELDSISVKPSPTCREDSECYDVETAFFDPENVLRSKVVLAQTFDVSDVVPVMLGDDREFRRR